MCVRDHQSVETATFPMFNHLAVVLKSSWEFGGCFLYNVTHVVWCNSKHWQEKKGPHQDDAVIYLTNGIVVLDLKARLWFFYKYKFTIVTIYFNLCLFHHKTLLFGFSMWAAAHFQWRIYINVWSALQYCCSNVGTDTTDIYSFTFMNCFKSRSVIIYLGVKCRVKSSLASKNNNTKANRNAGFIIPHQVISSSK